MWVEKDFTVRISPKLSPEKTSGSAAIWISSFDGKRLILPDKFQPDPELLLKHQKKCLAIVESLRLGDPPSEV
jgi:hypothetical protein